MNTVEQFLNRYRTPLQHFIDDDTRIIENHPTVLRFVDAVLNDWDTLHAVNLPRYAREEMTFWFCLYKLESVSEIPPDLPMMQFEENMFECLRQVREVLRKGEALPEKFYASRPGFMATGNMDEEDAEDEMLC